MIQIAYNINDLLWDAFYMGKYIASAHTLPELLIKLANDPEIAAIENEFKAIYA